MVSITGVPGAATADPKMPRTNNKLTAKHTKENEVNNYEKLLIPEADVM